MPIQAFAAFSDDPSDGMNVVGWAELPGELFDYVCRPLHVSRLIHGGPLLRHRLDTDATEQLRRLDEVDFKVQPEHINPHPFSLPAPGIAIIAVACVGVAGLQYGRAAGFA